MKNWNYINGAEVGNESIASHPDSAIAQEIYKTYLECGKDKKKTLEKLSSKYKNIPLKGLEKHIDDAVASYSNRTLNSGTEEQEEKLFYGLKDDAEKEEEKSDEALDELKKTGNFKTGKSALKPGDRVQSYGVQGTVRKVEGEDSDNIYGEPIIEVEWDNGSVKKVGEHYLRKIGNKVGNSTVSEYNAEIQRLTRKAEQLRRMGQGKQAMEVEKQIEKLGKELHEVGNSSSDDKFAYVMREFDEGKLKTPDGKVVTDPAQAKAIAYSESKKTENGLARARNAIKKNS